MKRLLRLLTCILLAVMLLTVMACSCAPKEKEYPEHYAQFSELLGENRETVLRRLQLTGQDVVPAPGGLYATPITAQYNGLLFDVLLDFDEANDRLCGFSYVTEWDRRSDSAVRDAGALAKALTKTFGEAREDIDPARFSQMSEEDLTAAFYEAAAKGEPVGTDYWLIEKRNDPTALEYVAAIREQTGSGRAIADCLNLTLEMRVGISEATDSVGVILQFRLEAEYLSN